MPTTTNYGWTTPADTDLVKDGASAIRTLGSSIDTSVKALNPGTTSGDLDYYTSATAKARLAKGTAGQVLAMNSGATAPEWITSSSGGMTLLSTTTLSGATTTISSISGSYNSLVGIVRLFLPATDGANLKVRLNGVSTANYAMFNYNTANSNIQGFTDTEIQLAGSTDNAVTQAIGRFEIPDYANTTTWKYLNNNMFTNDNTTSTSVKQYNNFGIINQTNAITSLVFLSGTGNLTSGTVLLYGVK